MNQPNQTVLTEFILMGITDRPELQAAVFGLFLSIYVISVVGNLGMIILTKVDSRLQTPMYFFLRHLAVTDLGYSTTVGPKMLVNFIANQNTIPYNGCATQLAFFILFIISELFILSAMAYDRYMAICHPLLYMVVMSQKGRHKAFSTCGSHLTVVVVLYATLFFMYVQPKSSHSFDTDKIASVFYTLIIPMLNPMIYSLRNKEVKGALHRIWKNLHKLPM
ncbi:olfactory receptor 8K1-like [Puma concolor]|uniref:Olfactory receptor 8K1-like n=1 Tax=Puma concolor TaxID=9696 RepID=A0A6P6I723_PUMCO|nr:olfactory receptor 8K1-like [Puma concolor]